MKCGMLEEVGVAPTYIALLCFHESRAGASLATYSVINDRQLTVAAASRRDHAPPVTAT